MILIIKKIKNKIAYQMWVAANLKIKYIWNLNSLEFTWVSELTQNLSHTHTTKTHTKQLNNSHTLILKKKTKKQKKKKNESHTQLKQKAQEEQSRSKLNKKKKKEKQLDKIEGRRLGEWPTTWENNQWRRHHELSAANFFHFLQVFSTARYPFFGRDVQYSAIRPV